MFFFPFTTFNPELVDELIDYLSMTETLLYQASDLYENYESICIHAHTHTN